MESFDRMVRWFANNGDSAAVALSGGVDSAVVALAAKKALGKNAVAITADYKTMAEEELTTARQVASEIGIDHKVIEYNELENPEFVKNDPMRCYHCRTELGQHLVEEAKKAGITLIVDGTNVDDLADYRPGIRALRDGHTRYGPPPGLPALREAICERMLAERGVRAAPDEVVVTPGAKPILFLAILATVGPGDEVLVPDPGFPIYESVVRFAGARVVPVPVREESGFSFDVEALFLARKKGYRIAEVPVVWRNDAASRVSLLRGSLAFPDLLRIRANDWAGRYGL